MPVRSLSLTDFRSYSQLDLELGDGAHVVVGPNATGKTNLVEALVLLSSGRSHRSSADVELVRWGSPFARAGARLESKGRAEELEVVIFGATPVVAGVSSGLPMPGGGARKRIRVNGVNRRASALAPVLRSVLFAPEDMDLIVGSPSRRRGALDELLAQREVAAGATLSTYSRALTQRNSLLRRIREGAAERAELAYWDTVLIESGGRILDWRLETLAALAGPLAAAHREIAPQEPDLALRYASNVEPRTGESRSAALLRRLHETADREVWNGATLVGPHRDDVVFEAGGRDLVRFASRGQQRTAILALKLAEVDLLTELDGRPPLLLLDDVFSELDPERRGHLVRRIGSLPQAIVTTTTPDDLDQALVAAASLWEVAPGTVRLVRAGSPGPASAGPGRDRS